MTLAIDPCDRKSQSGKSTPAAVTISQRTCEIVLGVHRRAYLDSLPRYRMAGGEVLSLGRLRLVSLDDYLGWLRAAGAQHDGAGDDGGADDDQLARELGIRVVPS